MVIFRLIELDPAPGGREEWTWQVEQDGIIVAIAPKTYESLASCHDEITGLLGGINGGAPSRIVESIRVSALPAQR